MTPFVLSPEVRTGGVTRSGLAGYRFRGPLRVWLAAAHPNPAYAGDAELVAYGFDRPVGDRTPRGFTTGDRVRAAACHGHPLLLLGRPAAAHWPPACGPGAIWYGSYVTAHEDSVVALGDAE